MLGGQSSLANEKPALPLQVETDEVVLSWNVASRRSTRLRWTGCCFAVLMLFGGSASQIFPIASHVSAKPSHHIATAAFSPSLRLPVVDARGDRPAVTGLRKPGSKKLNLRRPMSGPRMGGSAGEPSDESKDSQFSRRSFTQLLGISPVGLPGIAGAQDIINNAKEPDKQPKALLEARAAKLNANKAATDSVGAAIKDGYLKATPKTPLGHRIGSADAQLKIEAWYDFACPFSKKSFLMMTNEVLPAYEKKAPGKIQFLHYQYPQPWHAPGAYAAEVSLAVEAVDPSKYLATCQRFFEKQEELVFDCVTYDRTRNELYELLAGAATEATGVDKVAVLEKVKYLGTSPNSGNETGQMLKWYVKHGRKNGIHVTPTVYMNGIEEGQVSSGWTLEQWSEYLDEKLK